MVTPQKCLELNSKRGVQSNIFSFITSIWPFLPFILGHPELKVREYNCTAL